MNSPLWLRIKETDMNTRKWIVGLALLAAALFVGLTLEPRIIPSVLIGKPVPHIDLPPLPGKEPGLIAADLAAGKVTLVNVWASWCGPCRYEHPQLMRLAKSGAVRMIGLNYKDVNANALKFLAELGDPYDAVGVDPMGRASIEWGVYGIPETFIVDGKGRIVFKQVGPLMPEDVSEKILPAIARAKP